MRRVSGLLPRRRWLLYLALALVMLLAGLITSAYWIFAPYKNLDILIINGTVIDGSGAKPRICDVGIRNGKIVALSNWRLYFSTAKLRIDATERIVAPGFIDVHTHIESNLPSSGPFRADNFLRQGVTTLITGNCGRSRTDIASMFRGLERNGSYVNVATLVGHNSVRQQVMDRASRLPTNEELNSMEVLVARAMKEGALGFSTGLEYVPGRFADTAEVVALAKVASNSNGIYASHIRDEGTNGIEAIREALDIGRQAHTSTQISHFKSSGPRQWHTMTRRLDLLDEARANGQPVTIDVYPYSRSSTTTDILLPDWALEGNRTGLRQAGESLQIRQKLHADIVSRMNGEGWKNLSHVRLAAGRPEWIGRTLAEVPTSAPDLNQQVENLIEISLRGGAQAIYASMDEQDVTQVMTYPFSVFGSDSAVRDPSAEYHPHPRGCGTFPRVLRLYVREQGWLSWQEAIHKASGLAAEIFGLENRGLLLPDYWADIVIFDPNLIADQADYEKPFGEPVGIDYVMVNGTVAVDHGAMTSAKSAGMPVKRVRN
jgi:N-acyl-D-amino-acid deacylase